MEGVAGLEGRFTSLMAAILAWRLVLRLESENTLLIDGKLLETVIPVPLPDDVLDIVELVRPTLSLSCFWFLLFRVAAQLKRTTLLLIAPHGSFTFFGAGGSEGMEMASLPLLHLDPSAASTSSCCVSTLLLEGAADALLPLLLLHAAVLLLVLLGALVEEDDDVSTFKRGRPRRPPSDASAGSSSLTW